MGGSWMFPQYENGEQEANSLLASCHPFFLFLETLDDGHVGHAAAFAHGLQAVTLVVLLECIDQRRHQLCAGAAERMAECDRPAIDIEPRRIGTRRLQPRHRYSGEGFIDLEQ